MRAKSSRGFGAGDARLPGRWRLEERLGELPRARAGDAGPVVAYADDDELALEEYVAQRGKMGAVVVVVRSLAPRPAGVVAEAGP